MTDKEIVETLEKEIRLTEYVDSDYSNVKLETIKSTLDLITRQQAEIERLKMENEILSINADTAFQDGLNEARDLYAKEVENEIKSEAVREFAERFEKEIKDVKFTLGQFYEIQDAFKDIIKEMER